jgi:hypothetical protein
MLCTNFVRDESFLRKWSLTEASRRAEVGLTSMNKN